MLLALAGRVTVELVTDRMRVYWLESPHVGLYLPPIVWHTIQYSPGTVQLALASQSFAKDDYLRDY